MPRACSEQETHHLKQFIKIFFALGDLCIHTGSNGTRCDALKNIIFTQMTKLINETKNLPMCLRLTIYKYHFLVSNFLYISIITLPIDQLSKLFCPERKKRYQEKNSSRKFPLVHVHDVVCMKSVGIIHIKQLSFT